MQTTEEALAALAAVLRAEMGDKKVSQAELAHRTGISRQQIHGYYHGKAWPAVRHLLAIANALDTSAASLIERAEGRAA